MFSLLFINCVGGPLIDSLEPINWAQIVQGKRSAKTMNCQKRTKLKEMEKATIICGTI